MRIVGGKYKGRRLHPPKETLARPTTDFAKESLFNILQHTVPLEGIRVLDLFAGTGSISVEFLSRGAEEVISVEQDRELFTHLQRAARDLGITNWHHVRSDVFAFLRTHRAPYDIVFADPPFTLERTAELPALIREAGLLAEDGLLIIEHSKRTELSSDPWFRSLRPYSNIHFSFFGPPNADSTASSTPGNDERP